MDKFLETYNLVKLNYKEIKYLSRKWWVRRLNVVFRILPKKKISGPDGFADYCQRHKEEIMLILLKLFQKKILKQREHSQTNLWSHRILIQKHIMILQEKKNTDQNSS